MRVKKFLERSINQMERKKINITTVGVFKDALWVSLKKPSTALFFLKTIINQRKMVIGKLKKESVFFGTSLTMTRQNFELVTDLDFVTDLTEKGCKVFFYVEYTPIVEGTEDWILTGGQRKKVPDIMKDYRKRFSALFAGLPAEEDLFGGCLSAGRGFIHLNAEGDLEPCPFAPFSDVNLRDMTLKEALQSRLLEEIRKSQFMLDESEGGCSLWANRKCVESLLK